MSPRSPSVTSDQSQKSLESLFSARYLEPPHYWKCSSLRLNPFKAREAFGVSGLFFGVVFHTAFLSDPKLTRIKAGIDPFAMYLGSSRLQFPRPPRETSFLPKQQHLTRCAASLIIKRISSREDLEGFVTFHFVTIHVIQNHKWLKCQKYQK